MKNKITPLITLLFTACIVIISFSAFADDNNNQFNLNSNQLGLAGPLQINVSQSSNFGLIVDAKYAKLFALYNALMVEAAAGPRSYRLALTYGRQLSSNQSIKLTAEHLAQDIDYSFVTGNTRQWSQQNAFGLGYLFDLPWQHVSALTANAYYSKADSEDLSNVIFNSGLNLDQRRIAGAKASGMGVGFVLNPWANGLIDATVNYDSVRYATRYISAPDSQGLGETLTWRQLITPQFKMQLMQSDRKTYDQYQLGIYWLPKNLLQNHLQIGFNFEHTRADTAAGNDNQVELQFNYLWNKHNSFVAPRADETSFNTWGVEPAVHMSQVLTVADEKVSLNPGSHMQKTDATKKASNPNAPIIKSHIPAQTAIVGKPFELHLDKNKLFGNPVAPWGIKMVLHVSGLPKGFSATPANDVNLISGTATEADVKGSPYTVVVTADNGLKTSQEFKLTISGNKPPPPHDGELLCPGDPANHIVSDGVKSYKFTPKNNPTGSWLYSQLDDKKLACYYKIFTHVGSLTTTLTSVQEHYKGGSTGECKSSRKDCVVETIY